jgi:hypothetical protein
VNIESQVKNESGDQQSITLSAVVVDADGKVVRANSKATPRMVAARTEIFKANGKLADAKFWSDENPNLYDVYSILTVNDKVVDVQKIKTGFRKAEFKGGAGTGGVYFNDKFVWLTGYSRSARATIGPGLARRIPIGCTITTRNSSAARTRITSAGCTSRRRPWMCARATRRHRRSLSGGRQGTRPDAGQKAAPPTAASGTSASKSCATR